MARCVVTVGTTAFTPLINAALSSAVLSQLLRLGISELFVQHGQSPLPALSPPSGLRIQTANFTNDIEAIVAESTLVISHAGAGTIISALRSPRPPTLVLVPNPALMDAHQSELAGALSDRGWAFTCSCDELESTLAGLQSLQRDSNNVPAYDPEKIKTIVGRAAGLHP
ncbi:glycosyltransferase family 1 protein [Atractiella rhizophila]|nr:glycosyltransferase family 1 protein [Atractiella rhizophila]